MNRYRFLRARRAAIEPESDYRCLMVCQVEECDAFGDITAADGDSQREAELLISAGWDGVEDFWYCPRHKYLLERSV